MSDWIKKGFLKFVEWDDGVFVQCVQFATRFDFHLALEKEHAKWLQ